MAVFAVNSKDGTLVLCRAKPENRGKGRCPHEGHVERTEEDSSEDKIRQYNEERLKEFFHGNLFSFRQNEIVNNIGLIEGHGANGSLSPEEFQEATENLADAFTQDDWTLLQNFYQDLSLLMEQENALGHVRDQVIDRVTTYLQAEDVVASKVRAFLGEEIDYKVFAHILVNEVKSMTMPAVVKNSKKRDRMGRVVSTSCANDMTRKRYVASVLFFGGRCCYCSQVLSKEPGQPNQATGEHLTPINPENPESPRGVTRYGNMALACHACNDSRKNQELESWLKKTSLVPPEQKEKTIHRIEAFRKFALYEEYSPQQSQAITDVINELKEAEANLPREVTPQGIFEPQAHREFVSKVKEKLFDLSQTLKE